MENNNNMLAVVLGSFCLALVVVSALGFEGNPNANRVIPEKPKKIYKRILRVEDGSVDINELKEGLPDDIKVVVVRQGSRWPELTNIVDNRTDGE